MKNLVTAANLRQVVFAGALMGATVLASAQETQVAAASPQHTGEIARSGPAPGSNAALYCSNIADAAADARYARQSSALAELEQQLSDRIAELEAKRAEFEDWVSRREAFLSKADESVVAIYSQMRPDAAAEQIAIMDPEAAAAILAKVTPRTASAILNEMDPGTAADLTNVMAGRDQEEEADAG